MGDGSMTTVKTSRLTFVDLAGSERVHKTAAGELSLETKPALMSSRAMLCTALDDGPMTWCRRACVQTDSGFKRRRSSTSRCRRWGTSSPRSHPRASLLPHDAPSLHPYDSHPCTHTIPIPAPMRCLIPFFCWACYRMCSMLDGLDVVDVDDTCTVVPAAFVPWRDSKLTRLLQVRMWLQTVALTAATMMTPRR